MLLLLQNIFNLLRFGKNLLAALSFHYSISVHKNCNYLFETARNLNNGSVPDRVFRKMKWYMISNSFMGKLLSCLLGEKISRQKAEGIVVMGALMGLTDCLIDDYDYDAASLRSLFAMGYKPKNAVERIFILFYEHFIKSLDAQQKEEGLSITGRVADIQAESQKQRKAGLSKEEVYTLTYNKGGISVVLCAMMFKKYKNAHSQALSATGGFIQFMNDAQDIYKDASGGITTFTAFQNTFSNLVAELDTIRTSCSAEVLKMEGISPSQKSFFVFSLYVLYCGIKFKLKSYSRRTTDFYTLDGIMASDNKIFKVNHLSFKAFAQITFMALQFRQR